MGTITWYDPSGKATTSREARSALVNTGGVLRKEKDDLSEKFGVDERQIGDVAQKWQMEYNTNRGIARLGTVLDKNGDVVETGFKAWFYQNFDAIDRGYYRKPASPAS